jgi:hypothetical protein
MLSHPNSQSVEVGSKAVTIKKSFKRKQFGKNGSELFV